MAKILTRFRLLPYIFQIACLSLLYVVTGKIGFLFAQIGGNVTLIWPPTGISLAVILLLGYRYWPMIPIGAAILNLWSGAPLTGALMMAGGNSLETLGGVFLLRRFSPFSPSFRQINDTIWFIGFAAVIGSTFSATIGVLALCLTGLQDWSNFGSVWWIWWLGDAMSALVLTPVLLVWLSNLSHKQGVVGKRKIEFIIFALLLITISLLVFDTALATSRLYPLVYIPFPFVVWAALRFGQRQSLISSLIISLIATLGTTQNTGPFVRADMDINDSLIYLWTYVGTITITSMLLSSALAERGEVQDALLRSEARFRSVYQGANVGIAVINREGYTISANNALIEMLGYSQDDLLRTTFRDITHPEDVDASDHHLDRLLSNEIQNYSLEKRYLHKDGHIVWAQVGVSQFPSDIEGRHVRIAIIQDISERRRAETALHQLTAELERRVEERTAQLLAANERLTELDHLKSKFIADVSHELRTPLTVLNTRVYLLERSHPDQWPNYLNGLRDQIDRLIRFVNNILDLSRLELGEGKIQFGAVNLNRVVEQVSVALAPRAEANGLRLKVVYADNLPPVHGELNQLAQVATNLIANAINYTPTGTIEVSTASNGTGACLRVRDTGIGISPDDMPHLFERFYRGESKNRSQVAGTGLGLSIVKEIVDLHSGKIEVESQVGKGTTFMIWLPFWQAT